MSKKFKKRLKTTVPVGTYSIKEVMTFREENKISDRVKFLTYLIERDGTKCKCCGKEGTHFEARLWRDKTSGVHLDLYSDDGSLLTRDHIIPKSKGGLDTIDNFQLLCEYCNSAKSNHLGFAEIVSRENKFLLKLQEDNKKLQQENIKLKDVNQYLNIRIKETNMEVGNGL